jgi:Dehydrogenases with different specificities (related to short-chain alcohol dehydrogenases)
MVDYGLKNRVALITGANNPQGIGAATAAAFAREGAKVVLVYKKVPRQFDEDKTIQKAVESYRITPEQKDYLRTLRRKK